MKLDFSGGPTSWFDFWHDHVDWKGEGNKNWDLRKNFLQKLRQRYDEYRLQLINYPHDYQLWISIDESDSGEDAVYIHTKNPNEDNFPIRLTYKKPAFEDSRLEGILKEWGFRVTQIDYDEGKAFYLFDSTIGIPLIKE